MRFLLHVLVLATLLAPPGLLAGGVAERIAFEAPYARAVPPGQPNSAAFLALTNRDRVDHALVAAASDAAEVVELHTHREEGGMLRMRRIERIELPAGERVQLAPGGLHLMLIGLHGPLRPGDQIRLVLTFDDGSRADLIAPVEALRPGTVQDPGQASGPSTEAAAHHGGH